MPDGFVRHGMHEARGSSPLSSTALQKLNIEHQTGSLDYGCGAERGASAGSGLGRLTSPNLHGSRVLSCREGFGGLQEVTNPMMLGLAGVEE